MQWLSLGVNTGQVVSSATKNVFGNKKHKDLERSLQQKQCMETLLVRLMQVG